MQHLGHDSVFAAPIFLAVLFLNIGVGEVFITRSPKPVPACFSVSRSLLIRKGKVPTKDDLVLAVSHAWSHQLHPDPLGNWDLVA